MTKSEPLDRRPTTSQPAPGDHPARRAHEPDGAYAVTWCRR